MSLRMGTYLDSIDPNNTLMGNTGATPEKVEALGAIPREGGELVRKICEVRIGGGGGEGRYGEGRCFVSEDHPGSCRGFPGFPFVSLLLFQSSAISVPFPNFPVLFQRWASTPVIAPSTGY